MRKFWNRLSLSYKLFIGILAIISMVISFLLFYLWKYESKILIDKIEISMQKEIKSKKEDINNYFQFLSYELDFLSKLEVMDDLAVLDTDRRITRILEMKAKDLGDDIVITAAGSNGVNYASSKKNYSQKRFQFFSKLADISKKGKRYFFTKKSLILFRPIYASFDKNLFLGYLILLYPLENLKTFTSLNGSAMLKIYPPFQIKNNLKFQDDYIVLNEELLGFFKGWHLVYAVLKKDVLSVLYHIQTALISAFLIALILMTFLLFVATSALLKPLRQFSKTIKKIISTKDYSQKVYVSREDEIANLANSFNVLMDETNNLFEKLKNERKEHFEALVMLINFFIKITSAKDEKETLEISNKELKKFSRADKVFFDKNCKSFYSIEIENRGLICIKEPKKEWIRDKDFRLALSKMISLQIEKIELLRRTKEILKAKNAFFSAMSHELKTPLGSILSLTQIMIRDERDIFKVENLVKIEQAAFNLLTTINDILDFAKIESGNLQLNIKEFEVCQAIEEVYELLAPLAFDKDIDIEIKCKEKIFINSDRKLFKHILSNLLTNSIKFTKSGDIEISLKKRDKFLEIVVKDSGIGIDPSYLDKVFEEFYQIKDENYLQNIRGSGLGLTLSKKIAKLLKGDLKLYSKGKNRGVEAVFSIKSF